MSDYRNPLSVNIPYEFKSPQDYPSEAVAARFQAYRDILKSLIDYLGQYASVQEEIVRQQVRLQQAVGAATDPVSESKYSGSTNQRGRERRLDEEAISALNNFFLPIGNGSIQDIPTIFAKFHQQNVQNGRRTLKEIRLVVIPKLDDLRKDLLSKIKEIKSLHNDFDSKLPKELSATGSLLAVYSHSIDLANRLDMASTVASKSHHEPGNVTESLKKDPFLAKMKLQTQLKHQLREEEYLYRAYQNLQTSGEQLESIVVKEIQNYLGHFLGLIEAEKNSVSNFLVPTLSEGLLAKEPNFEWQSYVERNLPRSSSISNRTTGQFIDLSFPARKVSDLSISQYNSLLSIPVRQGYLERKSKFLKSNTRSYYVLTCCYLHEFKTHDIKKDPSNSISLDYCLVSEHPKDVGGCKFDLYSKAPNSLMHRSHTSVFKCETPQAMREWMDDIKTLTSFTNPMERAKHMSKVLSANNTQDKDDSRVSRVSSILSAQTNTISVKSGATAARANVLNTKKRHSILSKNDSLASSAQHHRLPSTYSNSNQQAQLNDERDDAFVSSREENHPDNEVLVDEQGDLLIKGPKAPSGGYASSSPVPQLNVQGIPVATPYQNSNGFSTSANLQGASQMLPQNYQYFLSQAHQQQAQQFYDPVLQQFFTINAVPALQVGQGASMQQYPLHAPNGSTPIPQYFPSSPQPNQNSGFLPNSGTPPIFEFSGPQPNQEGQINGSGTPYPVQFGEPLKGDEDGKEALSPKNAKEVQASDTKEDNEITDLAGNVSDTSFNDS